MLLRFSLVLSLSSLVLVASSLDIYSDRSFYTYQPRDSFIGFNTALSAKDSSGSLELIKSNNCANATALCQESTALHALHVKRDQITKEQEILKSLVSQYSPNTSIDADKTIQTASKIASRMAQLEEDQKNVQHDIQQANTQFFKHAPSKEALFFAQKPTSDVTLTITRGLVFESHYLLNIDQQNLEHALLITNRSGVDIEAKEVKLFAKPAGYISAPIAFYPQIIQLAPPAQKRAIAQKSMPMMAMDAAAAPMNEALSGALHVSKDATRSYRMKELNLPSDGKEQRVPVNLETLPITSKLTWHPYNSSNVYLTARITPKQNIESNQFKVRQNGELIENAPILKEGKDILIHVAIDYDLETKREKITDFSEDKGLFNSDRLKKEGFKLTLTNRSKISKEVEITERIPLSTQEEIVVTLEALHVKHTYDKKNGKLTMEVSLQPEESKKIEVRYAIRYPKEGQLYY
jgi:hypothetical protein